MAYDLVQSVFLMSLASNGIAGLSGTQPRLAEDLRVFLSGGTLPDRTVEGFFPSTNPELIGGDWRVVWGPCVFVPVGDVRAANALYVAYSPSQATYVVSVAATNGASLYDWVFEDLWVLPGWMAPWPLTLPYLPPAAAPTGPAVSAATALGVSNLLCSAEMVDPGSGLRLDAFLAGKRDADATLIFCGHSLAGALTPVLAFHLYPAPATSGWGAVRVLPSAGATPGNGAFAALYGASAAYAPVPTGLSPYTHWNTDCVNRRDIVPHAWDAFSAVVGSAADPLYFRSIYGTLTFEVGAELVLLCTSLNELAAGGGYAAIPQGAFDPDWGCWDWAQSPPRWRPLPDHTTRDPIASMSDLALCMAAAHVDQYQRHFGVGPFMPLAITPAALAAAGQREARRRALLAAARLTPHRSDAPPRLLGPAGSLIPSAPGS